MMGYGYENAAGDRISALIDMINGGGPGRSGGTFEGGGILSLLANAVAKPYGSVRERPGHTPMGAAAPPRMEVLRPEPVDAAVLPGSADVTIPPYTLALQGERPVPEATSGRTFTEEDFVVLGRVHPEVAKLFSGVRVGDPLSPQQAMFLDAARAGLDAPSAALTFPAPTAASSDPTFDPTFFTQEVSAAPAAETAAPLVSLRPKPRPDAGITIPPYTLALQGEIPVPEDILTRVVKGAIDRAEERPSLPVPEDILTRVVKGAIDRAEAGPELPSIPGGRRFMEEDLAVLGNLHPDLAALFIGMRPGDPLSPQQAMFLDAARVGSAPASAS